jgi:hypothetical protein
MVVLISDGSDDLVYMRDEKMMTNRRAVMLETKSSSRMRRSASEMWLCVGEFCIEADRAE